MLINSCRQNVIWDNTSSCYRISSDIKKDVSWLYYYIFQILSLFRIYTGKTINRKGKIKYILASYQGVITSMICSFSPLGSSATANFLTDITQSILFPLFHNRAFRYYVI